MCRHADVVELADALASGASGGNSVRVQVPPSAPYVAFKKVETLGKPVNTTFTGFSLPAFHVSISQLNFTSFTN